MVRMMHRAALVLLAATAPALAEQPVKLTYQRQDDSVYALPAPRTEAEGVNMGGVNIDMTVTYLTDYVYRGVDQADALNIGQEALSGKDDLANEDAANFQFDGTISFDLGKFPHPFIGVFANVLEDDPISSFQEVRPFFGAEWRIRPLIVEGGMNVYTYPDRNDRDTSEVWGKITIDDAAVFRTAEPLLSPYILAAYDIDRYDGWYFEAGIKHDFVIAETGITLTAQASVAYVLNHDLYDLGLGTPAGLTGDDTGFQHYELGLIGRYALNRLLNIPQRYGTWSINGYLYYTDGIDDKLRGDTELYGGAGIQFSY